MELETRLEKDLSREEEEARNGERSVEKNGRERQVRPRSYAPSYQYTSLGLTISQEISCKSETKDIHWESMEADRTTS